jgi:hypothetical protein
LLVLAAALAASRAGAGEIAQEAFERLHALVLPCAGEDAWAEIPWKSDLFEARRAACEAGRPIFLWEMDGNPLGCT